MQKSKRVILVQGGGAKWYEQAIFIMSEDSKFSGDFVTEAENIVERFIAAGGRSEPTVYSEVLAARSGLLSAKKRKGSGFILNAVMIFCCVMVALFLGTALFR